MNRDLDGIYLMIKRGEKYEPVCLSDMTKEELEANLPEDKGAWLKGAVIHLARTLHEIGEVFDIARGGDESEK